MITIDLKLNEDAKNAAKFILRNSDVRSFRINLDLRVGEYYENDESYICEDFEYLEFGNTDQVRVFKCIKFLEAFIYDLLGERFSSDDYISVTGTAVFDVRTQVCTVVAEVQSRITVEKPIDEEFDGHRLAEDMQLVSAYLLKEIGIKEFITPEKATTEVRKQIKL